MRFINNFFTFEQIYNMNKINAFLFIKDPMIEQKIKECLQRFHSINIIDFATDNITFVERYRYQSYQLLIIDLTQDFIECLDVLETTQKPSLTLGIISNINQAYQLLNKGFFDVIADNFTAELFTKRIGKIKKTIDFINNIPQDVIFAAENNSLYNASNRNPKFCFLKYKHVSVRVQFEDIVLIKNYQRYLTVTLSNGKIYKHYSSLKKFYEILPKRQFARINNRTIVNISNVEKIEKNNLFILNEVIEITRIYLQNVRHLIEIR